MHHYLSEIKVHRVVAIIPSLSLAATDRMAFALQSGGIRFIEVTFRADRPESWRDTADGIRLLTKKYGDSIVPGAGLVFKPEQVQMAHYAGAQFVVLSHVDASLVSRAKSLGMTVLCCAATPNEILMAHLAGADVVQIFPAGVLGLAFFHSMQMLFPHIPMLAAGGMDTQNAGGFLQAGAIGFSIFDERTSAAANSGDDWDQIAEFYRRFLPIIEESRPLA